ncbi:MAG: protoglobin domain-containing protein [Acidimicrobiales bacterium]
MTARESQVIAMCADGLSNQEIADALFVNIETVKSHLKRAYGRLGLRNRAEVATYVHHHREAGRFAPRVGRAMTPEPIAPQLGLSDAVLAERRHLMGLSSTSRASLTDRADDVAAGSAAYADRLIARWLTAPTTAPYLEQDAVAKRLAEHQARYLESLFGSDLGGEHVEMVLRIGATHHRLKLPPQWHLASYAHLIGEHLGLLFDRAGSVHGFLETVDVLVRSVLFDTSLMLDAYEMHLVQEILDDEANRPTASDSYETDEGIDAEHIGTPVVAASMSRLAADLTQVGVRRDFIGLDADRLSILRRIAPEIEQAIPAMLDDFYSLVAETPSTAELVDDSSIDRLINQVDIYWRDLLHSRFDRGHAASRMRVGMVHERIGLAPQFYVAGLGRQLGGILHALERDPSPVDAVDALLRAVFFDLTFVIDAYVEARANALTQTDRFASQLIAGLSTGMAIVDVRNRIEVVNQQLLDLVGIPAAIAHRMPVADALPFAGIDELVDAVRQTGGQRRSKVGAIP